MKELALSQQLISGADEPPWLPTLTGQQIRIKVHGRETEGRVTVIEYVEQPHTTPPVYTRHEFVEVFCVLSGRLMFKFWDEPVFTAVSGTTITCPSWKPHSFWNEGDEPVRALLVCSPAGLDRFFEESSALRERMPPERVGEGAWRAAMKELRDRFGLEHMGPAPIG
ncbi:MAG: cupin domain-containing protein [Ardenticatenaceae bacterium]|nr:cupin domain-containing protein [Ardenticatenaceae bacterium]